MQPVYNHSGDTLAGDWRQITPSDEHTLTENGEASGALPYPCNGILVNGHSGEAVTVVIVSATLGEMPYKTFVGATIRCRPVKVKATGTTDGLDLRALY